jgi:hypothetical protein
MPVAGADIVITIEKTASELRASVHNQHCTKLTNRQRDG